MSESIDNDRIQLLYKAIEDAQNTIRFTDTKAGAILVITGGLITILVNISKQICAFLKALLIITSSGISPVSVLVHAILIIAFSIGVILLLATVLLAFIAISPKSNPVSSVDIDVTSSEIYYLCNITPAINPLNAFTDKNGFFKLNLKTSLLVDRVKNLNRDQILELLAVELQKVSYIRELKIRRIQMAIRYLKYSFILFTVVFIPTMIYSLYC